MKHKFSSLLASAGFAAFLLVSAPALAQAYLGVDLVPYGVLAGSTVTCAGAGSVTGDVGVSPGAAIVGFPAPCTASGTLRIPPFADAGQANLLTAFGTLDGRVCDGGTIGPDLAGLTLTPGTYCVSAGATNLSTFLLLNAQGNPAATWVFKASSTLITSVGSTVTIINGGGPAQACGVQWLVQSSATINSGTTFLGNILALTDITLNGNVTGRALARNGQVTMTGGSASFAACGAAGGIGGVPPPFSVFGAPPASIAPTLSKAFSLSTINAGGGSTLTITLTNANAGAATLTAPFTDNLPSGVTTVGLPTTTCGGVPSATASSVTLPLGTTIPGGAPGSCTLTVNVTAATGGSFLNTLPANALQTTNGSNAAPAVATLTAVVNPIPTLSEWAMIMLAGLLALFGFVAVRRQAR